MSPDLPIQTEIISLIVSIGESLLLNNLCVGLAVYLCAQDGISSLEADAIKTVSSGLKNVDSEIALLMANSMQKVLESIDDEE